MLRDNGTEKFVFGFEDVKKLDSRLNLGPYLNPWQTSLHNQTTPGFTFFI